MEYITLNNGQTMPAVMIGTYQLNNLNNMEDLVATALLHGCHAFDTSPSYQTEQELAQAIKNHIKKTDTHRSDYFIQTKIDSWQMIKKRGAVKAYVVNTLKLTGLDYWDSLLIHWPQPEYLVPTWLAFEEMYKEGLVKNIGVCNFEIRHFQALIRGGASIKPMIVQNEIHPFHTNKEVVDYCRENDIILQAYSPLCRMLDKVTENNLILELAKKYNKPIASIILKWHCENDIIPIVKSSHPERVKDNLEIFDFSLTEDDINKLNNLNENFKIFLESRCCPGY